MVKYNEESIRTIKVLTENELYKIIADLRGMGISKKCQNAIIKEFIGNLEEEYRDMPHEIIETTVKITLTKCIKTKEEREKSKGR